jgi:UDP-N-acetylmuramyl pentapeptide phosphotransferase/UDP-N-acetylglucosamine-1-phosphate transferase
MTAHLLIRTAAASLVASSGLTWIVREHAKRKQLLDHPNQRSSHARPVPRLGGLALMATFVVAGGMLLWTHAAAPRAFVVLGATAAVSVLGLIDDLRSLPARTRLVVQVLLAVAVVASAWADLPQCWSILGASLPRPVLAVVSVLWLTWLTNLYNFMDGIDGLAGGQAVITSAAVAVAAFASDAHLIGALLVILAASSLGFLLFNFPPASIFMGDVGSTAIGFFFAAVPFLPGASIVPVDTVALALSLFILDATVTLARRLARGERLSQAHRTHHYQRPLAVGVPHRTITLIAYAAMLLVGTLAMGSQGLDVPGRWGLVAGAVGVFAVLAALVVGLERREARRRHAVQAPGEAL